MFLARPIWDTQRVAPDPRLAFVLMPFTESWSSYIYRDFIQPLTRDCGLNCKRADELFGRNVLTDIWRAIASCRLVIADLTARNPNVFYELGIAHTLGKPAVLLTQSMDHVPFDLRVQRIIPYTDNQPGYSALRSELPRHIREILAEPVDELYQFKQTLGGFLVKHATLRIALSDPVQGTSKIFDSMDIVGVRDGVPLFNKGFSHTGTITEVKCNHRFVRSQQYPDFVRVCALFDAPYVNTGTEARVDFEYELEGAILQEKRWSYDIAVDTDVLEFELEAPRSAVRNPRIVKILKPTEYEVCSMSRVDGESSPARERFRAVVSKPEVKDEFAMIWE